MPNYIQELREKVGSKPLIIVGSTVLVMDADGRILLQKRSDSLDWGLPGGAMEPGESFEETARRELQEETNLQALNLKFLRTFSGPEFYYRYPNGDESYNVISLFLVTAYDGDLRMNDDEGLALQFFAPEQWPELEERARRILNELGNVFCKR